MKKVMLTTLTTVLILVLGFAVGAQADFTINLDTPFSNGGVPIPAGPSPWLTATFTDEAGGVQLTLQGHLQDGNFVDANFGWGFNIDPTLEAQLGSLNFAQDGGPEGGLVNYADTIVLAANGTKADGDGYFDINLEWNANGVGGVFTDSQTATYLITGISGLLAADFDFPSSETDPNGHGAAPNGTWISAAHVQGITSTQGNSQFIGGDGKIPPIEIPEPSTIILIGAGLLAFGVQVRKRMQK